MKKNLKLFLWIGLFLFLAWSCSKKPKETFPSIPEIETSASHVNQDIDLILYRSQNTLKINDRIVVSLHLKTDIQVRSDFDMKMYILDKKNDSWTEVMDNIDTSIPLPLKQEIFILDKNNPVSVIVVHPALKEKDSEVKFLITVTGTIVENGKNTNRSTESYTIVTLTP
ncbi:MAG: hypothetical protein IT311_13710 [Anaerolineales bacterium]|nr:hypothetical protein [Anaerolineales bacterium]MCZ2122160.1 hypothetical protein [Anaerolineales bacterium]